MEQPVGWIDVVYWLMIAGAYLLGRWSSSSDAVGHGQANPPRSRIEDAAGRVS